MGCSEERTYNKNGYGGGIKRGMKVMPEAYLMPLIERISSGEQYDSRSLDSASDDVYCDSSIIILIIRYP